jgi:hypothetical protein
VRNKSNDLSQFSKSLCNEASFDNPDISSELQTNLRIFGIKSLKINVISLNIGC